MLDVDAIDVQLLGCLEDTMDKLQISGQIMPLTYEMRKNAKLVSNRLKQECSGECSDI